MKKILSIVLLTCFCSIPLAKASDAIIIGSDGQARYEDESKNEIVINKKENNEMDNSKNLKTASNINQADTTTDKTFLAIGKDNGIHPSIIEIVASCDKIPDNNKLSVMKTLNNHYKHLISRGDAYELAYFTGGTIIIPIITLAVVGIKEIIHLPSGINANRKLKLTDSTMKLKIASNYSGSVPTFYVEVKKLEIMDK